MPDILNAGPKPERIDHVPGDATGLAIPAHADALRAGGEAFLTTAFRAFGSIAPDNAVEKIERIAACAGGSTGDKLFLSVRYAKPAPDLHTELFVKFSRDFDDPVRDLQRFEMESEARFAAISRLPGFPIRVPAAYFGDFHHESGTGLLITQQIFFGQGAIEPQHGKTMDHKLDRPLPYYRAILTALARLAGAHKAGKLAPDIEARFPLDLDHASADPIPPGEERLRKIIAKAQGIALQCPQLFPEVVRTPAFHAQMLEDGLRIQRHEAEIQAYLRGNRDMIALCHWNAHIDNGWFWRDEAGALHNGLMDWGRVGQITFGSALWGCLSAAHHDIWDHHLDELLGLFAREYAAHGGPEIPVAELELHLLLHIAAMGVARVLPFPPYVMNRLPAAATASGPLDPIFETSEPARNCLHVYTVFLKLWQRKDFGARLDELLARG